MAAVKKKKISISVVVPFLVFILFFSTMLWQKYKSSREVPLPSSAQSSIGSRPITLFFSTIDGQLARESRDVEACEDDKICLKDILDELCNGPVGELGETVPEGAVVEGVHIEGSLATIDLNRPFVETMLSGSSAEMLAVYSIVNTVTVNFPYVQSVKLNVAGDTHAHLSHLDLSEPLLPDYTLEANAAQHSHDQSETSPLQNKGTVK